MLTTLCGGVGAARFLSGAIQVVEPSTISAIVNTGDDLDLHGLRICPDLDTITYTLAGLDNTVTGWGLRGETWRTKTRLAELGGEAWFALGDLDLATHLYRTERLRRGDHLTDITASLLSTLGVSVRLLPMTEDAVPTMLTSVDGVELSFQEYFVRHHHDVAIRSVRFDGADLARPGPGVLDAIATATVLVIAPSNPIVSIGPILAIPGVATALEGRRGRSVAISPIVGGRALKGPADRLLTELGHEASVAGIARLYAPFASTLVIDRADAHLEADVVAAGMACVVTDTIMDSLAASRHLAEVALGAVQ